MKIAISVPDEVFEAGEHLAHQLGISRSQLYVYSAGTGVQPFSYYTPPPFVGGTGDNAAALNNAALNGARTE